MAHDEGKIPRGLRPRRLDLSAELPFGGELDVKCARVAVCAARTACGVCRRCAERRVYTGGAARRRDVGDDATRVSASIGVEIVL